MASAAFWRAWSLWGVSMAATTAGLVSAMVDPLPASVVSQVGGMATGAIAVVMLGAFATVGALVAWKRPGNPIGWLLSATALLYAAGVFSLLLAHFRRMLTLVNWIGWVYLLGLGVCVFVLLLFPTGSLPSRRWRPVAWAAGVGAAAWTLGCAFAPTLITASPSMPNPVGLTGPAGDAFKIIAVGGAALIAATGLAAVVSLAFRYRRAGTAERQQLKWLVYASALIVAVLVAEVPIGHLLGNGDTASNVQNAMTSGAIVLVPVAIGFAVMRYRLYDIDRIISRTVAYAVLTGLLVGVYAGLVLLATEVLGLSSPIAVAAATLAAAAVFSPVRRRVQRVVDRRFNRAGYDAELTVAAFAARLKDAADLDAVRNDLAAVVTHALEPTQVWVWTSRRD
jgi:hypothetical protein